MTSGRVQLATTGVQDVFLTGKPDITYFEQVYTRHTKFALETLDNVFNNNSIDFGDTIRGTIQRRGDLVRNIYIRLELPVLDDSSNVGYTDSIGNAIIDYADLIVGGQVIQRINGEYMEIFNSMFVSESQQRAFNALIGTTGTRTGLGDAHSNRGYPRTLFIHLPFYFIRDDPISIPLCALYRQEVEIEVKLRPLSEIMVLTTGIGNPTIITTPKLGKVTMPVEYVFIEDKEIDYFRSKRIEHTITQLQMQSEVVESNTVNMRLNFINPVKEMYFVIQNESNVLPDQNDWFNYTNYTYTDNPANHQLVDLKLDFNNETYLDPDVSDALFMYAIQSMNKHTRVPNRLFYTYSFAVDPENYRPTGQVNMSRIQNKLLTMNLTPYTGTRNVRVYAKSYNILRIENGLAGVLFIDNNYY